MQTDQTLLHYASAVMEQKMFRVVGSKVYRSQTLRSNMKQGLQTQHVTSNNVASVCSGLNSRKVIYDTAVLSR